MFSAKAIFGTTDNTDSLSDPAGTETLSRFGTTAVSTGTAEHHPSRNPTPENGNLSRFQPRHQRSPQPQPRRQAEITSAPTGFEQMSNEGVSEIPLDVLRNSLPDRFREIDMQQSGNGTRVFKLRKFLQTQS